jgi:hypothetical protein
MGREATGQLRKLADGWEARIRIHATLRKGFELVRGLTDVQAEERCRLLAEMARRLRKSGHADDAVQLLTLAAMATAGAKLDGVIRAVDALCTVGGTVDAKKLGPRTFQAIGEAWTKGDLHRDWPDHVPFKKSADNDRQRLERIYPLIGHRLMTTEGFRLEHAEAAMRGLHKKKNGEPLSRSARRQYAQLIHRVAGFAVYPLRLMPTSPIPRGWLPKPNARLKYAICRPQEDTKLVGAWRNEQIPLCYCIFMGFLHREGMRREEAVALRWRNLDLTVEHGVVDLGKHKTDDEVTREPWNARGGGR